MQRTLSSLENLSAETKPFPENFRNFEFLSVDYFSSPEVQNLDDYFQKHPCQPSVDIPNLPFKPNILFYREDGVNRRWLSYCFEKDSLFCCVCLAYCDKCYSHFVNGGMKDWRHTMQRVGEHEKSKVHSESVESHMMKVKHKNIFSIMWANDSSLRRKNARERKEVLEKIISVIQLIGKRALAFRAHRFESAYTINLENEETDHGNFLEILSLLAKYDPVLKLHLSRVISSSKKRKENSISRGRGGLITLLSKSTVNHIICAIKKLIQKEIISEIQKAGFFSIQVDTTQDNTKRSVLNCFTICYRQDL